MLLGSGYGFELGSLVESHNPTTIPLKFLSKLLKTWQLIHVNKAWICNNQMWTGSNSCVLFIKTALSCNSYMIHIPNSGQNFFFLLPIFLWILSRQLYFWLVLFKVTRYEKRRKKGKAWSSFNQQNAFKRPYKIT